MYWKYKLGFPFFSMNCVPKSIKSDHRTYLIEKAFISGVCTKTPTNLTPMTEKPMMMAGYLNRSGCW